MKQEKRHRKLRDIGLECHASIVMALETIFLNAESSTMEVL
jgi:hypothetical protein